MAWLSNPPSFTCVVQLSSVVFVESSKGLKGGQAGDVNQLISILKRK